MERFTVVAHEEASHISLCLLNREPPPLTGNPFSLERSEETLGWCVVPAPSSAAHALDYPMLLKHCLEVPAGILTTLIRVEHQPE